MFQLTGKIAVVTGGSRGIGRACAEALASRGATVVVNYVKGEAAARECADAINAAAAAGAGTDGKRGSAEILGFDVADTKATEAAIAGVIERHGRIDVMVANAGISIDGLLLRVKDEDLDKIFATNVRGAITCARAATKSMMRTKAGRIVFLSSVVAEMGNTGQTAYAASKAAVIGAAKSIAREYASRNITVNVIAPGFIDSDMTSTMAPAMREHLLKAIPLARIGGAAEVAAGCVYLASDEAAYVTGQVLRINGGLYM
jgi:3-oxoacyl-[acyl-carrier protein] reductase